MKLLFSCVFISNQSSQKRINLKRNYNKQSEALDIYNIMSMVDETKSQPLVSIITPTYNRPEYLKVALESAVGQTYRNIEIIVSDNCSLENPQAIVESFNDARIRF